MHTTYPLNYKRYIIQQYNIHIIHDMHMLYRYYKRRAQGGIGQHSVTGKLIIIIYIYIYIYISVIYTTLLLYHTISY